MPKKNKDKNKEFVYISIGLITLALFLFSFSNTGLFTGELIDCGDISTFSGYSDADSDNLPDYCEDIYGTNKVIQDTDGDGRIDGQEIADQKDPLSFD